MGDKKYLIINTEAFSGKLNSKIATLEDLPLFVKMFIARYKGEITTILDESSFIKTNFAVKETDKSQRTRRIKLLANCTRHRLALTGTFMSKSPVNAYDQVHFLYPDFFNKIFGSMFGFENVFCITVALKNARGRSVIIPKKTYFEIRNQLSRAYKRGGAQLLSMARISISKFHGITIDDIDYIIQNKQYKPFRDVTKLRKLIEPFTFTLKRKDVFDIDKDYYIYNPIKKPVTLSDKAKKIGNELIKVGFTDNLVLGKAAAMELLIRMQDICNGFEPIKNAYINEDGGEEYEISYKPFPENPKLDMLIALLNDIDIANNQCIIWCTRVNAFNSIEEALTKEDISFVSYYGKSSDKEKIDAQEKMLNNDARVFIANPHSASFGLNALRNVPYTIWYCMDSSTEKRYQAMMRVLRGESSHPKFAYEIFVEGSVEERIYEKLSIGMDLLDGDITEDMLNFR